ncbi:THAP domain [Popillia japonica]|uniref:THAP domain n=1 Tax=Popillia japonica TaxID=7064 RepID=A0AAW1MA48_POPJA
MDLEETFNKWLQVIGNPAYLNKPKDYLYKNVMVCALHFKQDDFCMELNKGILKYGVIPSVNLKGMYVYILYNLRLPNIQIHL